LLAGTWQAADENGRGRFHGEWHNAAETVEGVLGGDFVQVHARPGGFFSGRWAMLCDQEAVESIP
jgi:hypothetical protein